jgi:hypothetical protein
LYREEGMSGECSDCWEHVVDCNCRQGDYASTLDCNCKKRLEVAMAALNLALQQFIILGFEIPENFELKRKD